MIVRLPCGPITIGALTLGALRKDHGSNVVIGTSDRGSRIVCHVGCMIWSYIYVGLAFGSLHRRLKELVLVDGDRACKASYRKRSGETGQGCVVIVEFR